MLLPFNIGTASGCQTLERLAANAIMLSNAAAGPNGRPNSAAAAEVPAGYLRKGETRRLGWFAHFLGCTGDSVCLSASRGGLVAYPTGSAQNQIRTSKSRSIEPYRCSCMAPFACW